MNVTCERCNTEYDFDDTLVSGRGTTVKCTNCGHLFKVRKAGADPAVAPEKWVVRTVDGRELQFNALRELQAAITQRTIGREDVLSRGSSRPRRLGAISELEPFFTSTGGPPQPIVNTSPGLGATTPLVPSPRGQGATAGLPSAHAPDPDAVMDSSDMQEDATVVRPPPVDPDTVPKMFPPPAKPAEKAAAKPAPKDGSPPPGRVPGAAKDGSPPPGRVPGAAKDGSPPPGRVPGAAKDGSPPPGKVPGAAKDGSPPPGRVPKEAPPKPPTKPTPPKGIAAQNPEHAAPPKPPEKPPARPPLKESTAGAKADKPPPKPPTKEAAHKASAEPEEKETEAAAPAAEAKAPPRKIPVTAPASDVKISHIGEEEPRFSTPRPQPKKSGGGAQRLVAFVAAGVLIFVGVTAARRFMAKPTVEPEKTAQAPDDRVGVFLAEADKALAEGDLQGAQSQLDKASALAEKDPKVASALALVATIQADFKWLKLRLLAVGAPEQPAVKQEMDLALERARKAVEAAQAVAPNDPAVARRRMDVLRIAGSLADARKLVSSIGNAAGQPDSALVLAELDLAEEKPSWPSVIERLKTAVVGEHSLGRARSMLIYALARSGDMAAAKGELDQLAGMPRPHPLLQALRDFVARSEGPIADAGIDAADMAPDEAIRLANELRARGDSKRAEEILLDVIKKAPTNSDALAGLGDIARSRSDSAKAAGYYEQALKANPLHVAALSGLADMRWDTNDRSAALALYRKVVENGSPGSAYVTHARERLGGRIPDDVPLNTVATTPTTPPTTPATTPTNEPTAPPPTVTTEPTTPPPPPPPSTTTPPPPPPPTNTGLPFELEK